MRKLPACNVMTCINGLEVSACNAYGLHRATISAKQAPLRTGGSSVHHAGYGRGATRDAATGGRRFRRDVPEIGDHVDATDSEIDPREGRGQRQANCGCCTMAGIRGGRLGEGIER